MKTIRILAVLLTILSAVGCTSNPDNQPVMTNQPTMIIAKVGEEFEITLDSNPTTGYQWKLSDNLTEGVVKLVKSEYVAPDTEMVGAGGKEIWTFKVVEPGETTVDLEYVRPW